MENAPLASIFARSAFRRVFTFFQEARGQFPGEGFDGGTILMHDRDAAIGRDGWCHRPARWMDVVAGVGIGLVALMGVAGFLAGGAPG